MNCTDFVIIVYVWDVHDWLSIVISPSENIIRKRVTLKKFYLDNWLTPLWKWYLSIWRLIFDFETQLILYRWVLSVIRIVLPIKTISQNEGSTHLQYPQKIICVCSRWSGHLLYSGQKQLECTPLETLMKLPQLRNRSFRWPHHQ